MNSKKCFLAIAIVAIAVCSVLGIVLIKRNNLKKVNDLATTFASSVAATEFVAEGFGDNHVSETDLSEESEQENEPITTEAPNDMSIATPPDKVTHPEVFAEITINTCEKTGTYAVMPNVYEETLKNNIGWLPSSSLPGEDGLCVFMGHRDADFKILQYVSVGDELIVKKNNSDFTYTATEIIIVSSDKELRFEATFDSTLVLVTCYPFHYIGHAPEKVAIFGKETN